MDDPFTAHGPLYRRQILGWAAVRVDDTARGTVTAVAFDSDLETGQPIAVVFFGDGSTRDLPLSRQDVADIEAGRVPAPEHDRFAHVVAGRPGLADVRRAEAEAARVEGAAEVEERYAPLRAAAKRLLDGCTPCVSALECEHAVSADDLYGDLAEALGLPRDYRPEDR